MYRVYGIPFPRFFWSKKGRQQPFTLIMTTRQALSIILSCMIYGHVLSLQALIGVPVCKERLQTYWFHGFCEVPMIDKVEDTKT